MSPETAAFLAALFRWTLAGTSPLDYAETVRGPRDSNVPGFSVVEDRPRPISVPASAQPPTPGVRVAAIVPHEIDGEGGTPPRTLIEFDFNSWPLTFAHHNAQLRSRAGRQALHEGWVAYVARGTFRASSAGAHVFSVAFRSPAATSCYGFLVIGGVEVFPYFERQVRRRVPPRLVLSAGERRSFQREVWLAAGSYSLELTSACHPGRKPAERLSPGEANAWQAVSSWLFVRTPSDHFLRELRGDELAHSVLP